MRLDHLLSKEQAEAEMRTLHPKVDCLGNQAEEKKRNESSKAPVAQKNRLSASSPVSSSGSTQKGSGRCLFGGIAQLGERLPCKQEATGSNPVISTNMGR